MRYQKEVLSGERKGTYIFGLILDLTEFSGRYKIKSDKISCLERIVSSIFGRRLTYSNLTR